MKQTDKCECGHKYSKEMNQKHPRRCVICGKKETQPNNILCFRCLEWNKSEEICNLRIKNINDCCEIHNQRLNKSHSQPLLSTKQSDVRAYGDKTGEMVNHLQPSPMPYNPLTKELYLKDYQCKYVLSALNGYEQDVNRLPNYRDVEDRNYELYKLLRKHFPILDEVKEE